MTPCAKAAARVPPPENASATTVLPPTSGGVAGDMMAASDATWTLMGSLNVVAHDPSMTVQATTAMRLRIPATLAPVMTAPVGRRPATVALAACCGDGR